MKEANPTAFEPYDFTRSAQAMHEKHGYDYGKWFDRCFDHGLIYKDPRSYLMAFPMDVHVDATGRARPPTWVVWWAEIHPSFRRTLGQQALISMFTQHMPWFLPCIAFARARNGGSKVSYYSTTRVMRLTGQELDPILT